MGPKRVMVETTTFFYQVYQIPLRAETHMGIMEDRDW